MNENFQPLDFGHRSNESDFAGLDELGPAQPRGPLRSALANSPAAVAVEWLPFTVGIVASDAMLQQVQTLRGRAYGHHLPEFRLKFSRADPFDRLPAMTLFYAQEKATGEIIGTARLQTNLHGPLQIEESIDELPALRRGQLLCEVTRLAVLPGCSHPVRLVLVKAIHLFCIANQIGGIIIGSRRSVLRQYLNIGFSCLFGDDRMVPLAHANDLEHRILFRDTVTSEAESRARAHPSHGFVFRTYHPDIQIFDSVLSRSCSGLGRSDYSSKAA